jgi:hypothetical protein
MRSPGGVGSREAGPVAVIMRTVGPLGIDLNQPMKPFRFVFRDRRSHASIPPRQQYDRSRQCHIRNLKFDWSVLYMCDESVSHQSPGSTVSSPQACLLYPRAAWQNSLEMKRLKASNFNFYVKVRLRFPATSVAKYTMSGDTTPHWSSTLSSTTVTN